MDRIKIMSAILLSCALVSCGGSLNIGGNNTGKTETVAISGSFSGGSHASNFWLDRFFAWAFPPAHALNPNNVSQVIALQGNGAVITAAVSNGSFSIDIDKSSPAGLIFAGSSNNYLGYLTLNNGIDSLPLNKLASGISAIDLGVLSSSGLVVQPSHNPIGTEILLTSEEQTAIAQGDDFLASVLKNPDVEGIGTIQNLLTGKYFRPFIMYFVNGGNFASALTPNVNTPANITGYRFSLDAHDTDTNFPAYVIFTGPQGSGLANLQNDQSPQIHTNSAMYGSPYITAPVIPPAGQYTVNYKNSILTFDIPDQSSTTSNIVVAVPTVTLNANGTIQKVNWRYALGSGATTSIDPQSIINEVNVQIDGSGTPCSSYPQEGRIYNGDNLPATATEQVLICQNLNWSDVSRMNIAYNDIYGNHIVVTWQK